MASACVLALMVASIHVLQTASWVQCPRNRQLRETNSTHYELTVADGDDIVLCRCKVPGPVEWFDNKKEKIRFTPLGRASMFGKRRRPRKLRIVGSSRSDGGTYECRSKELSKRDGRPTSNFYTVSVTVSGSSDRRQNESLASPSLRLLLDGRESAALQWREDAEYRVLAMIGGNPPPYVVWFRLSDRGYVRVDNYRYMSGGGTEVSLEVEKNKLIFRSLKSNDKRWYLAVAVNSQGTAMESFAVANFLARRDVCARQSTNLTCDPIKSFRVCDRTGERCECHRYGFVDNGGVCEDINECSYHKDCYEHSECVNIPGSFTCQCRPGFRQRAGWPQIQRCDDIDECRHGNVCGDSARCANTVGSYRCDCQDGFTYNGSTRSCVASVVPADLTERTVS